MDFCATKSWLGRIYFFISIASINIAAKEIKSRTNQHLFSKIAFLTVLVGIINNRVYERAICWQVIFCTHFYHVYGKAIKFLLFLVFSASPFSHEFIALFVSEFCECKNWIIDWGTCHENPLICPTTMLPSSDFYEKFASLLLLGLKNLGWISQNITFFFLVKSEFFFLATRASTELS